MKKLSTLILLIVFCFTAFAQQQKSLQTVTIQTNGVCEQCKKRMMDNVPQWAGVKECSYDVKTAKLTITYDSKKTSVDKLRQSVSMIGYDADNVKANAEARAKIPACCRQEKKADGGNHSGCGGGCGGCGHHH